MNKKLILTKILCVCIVFFAKAYKQDSLVVALNKTSFNKKDTISIDCFLKYEDKTAAAVTLNVWIEDINKTKTWTYRYPLLNGTTTADLVIGDSIKDGIYAMHFSVQKSFFILKGNIKDYNPKNKVLNYMMLAKNKQTIFGTLDVNFDGTFKTNRIAFEDTARFIFSPSSAKHRENNLYINIATPLDSSFTPIAVVTKKIIVGKPTDTANADRYTYNDKSFTGKFTLDEVIVKTTKKKTVELFDEEYASGFFKGGNYTLFDGLESTDIESSLDIFSFLQGKIAGLMITRDGTGGYDITWRQQQVDVYLDEFKVDVDNMSYVSPADVAMIKVFKPMSGPSNNGAIAIYTKRGAYNTNTSRKYNFLVKGFTPAEIVWK